VHVSLPETEGERLWKGNNAPYPTLFVVLKMGRDSAFFSAIPLPKENPKTQRPLSPEVPKEGSFPF
jgi:hypothetical protein